ncbi:MAG: Carbonic anhydrase, beta class [Candidatus Kapaibacterium sp.]|nr:MAG: Carbonic anhydrase, beta class [Candidatus Kapabacteria bacterium]
MSYLEKLKLGNEKFISKIKTESDFKEQFERLARAQNPHTIVITCSDSRVVPEYIFQCEIGELFVVRTAGGVLDSVALATVEFAVSAFDVKQIVVLGHTNCGAIAQAIKHLDEKENENPLLQKLIPIVTNVYRDITDEKDLLNRSVIENVKEQIRILENSELIANKVKNKEVSIIPAVYNLETGRVEFLNIENGRNI